MKIEMTCAECGKNRFNLADADNDASVIMCKDCGHVIGTLGDLKQKVADEVVRRAWEPQP